MKSGERGCGSATLMSALILPGPRGHDDDAVGQEHRLGERVRHEDDRLAGPREQDGEVLT